MDLQSEFQDSQTTQRNLCQKTKHKNQEEKCTGETSSSLGCHPWTVLLCLVHVPARLLLYSELFSYSNLMYFTHHRMHGSRVTVNEP